MEMNYASKGVGAAGLTTGIIGSALGALNSGIFSGILGGGGAACCESNMPINRYEANMLNEISAKDQKIALLESNIYTDSKIANSYERLDAKIEAVNATISQQAVFNATVTSNLTCLANQVAQLFSLAQLKIPSSVICPPITTTTTG